MVGLPPEELETAQVIRGLIADPLTVQPFQGHLDIGFLVNIVNLELGIVLDQRTMDQKARNVLGDDPAEPRFASLETPLDHDGRQAVVPGRNHLRPQAVQCLDQRLDGSPDDLMVAGQDGRPLRQACRSHAEIHRGPGVRHIHDIVGHMRNAAHPFDRPGAAQIDPRPEHAGRPGRRKTIRRFQGMADDRLPVRQAGDGHRPDGVRLARRNQDVAPRSVDFSLIILKDLFSIVFSFMQNGSCRRPAGSCQWSIPRGYASLRNASSGIPIPCRKAGGFCNSFDSLR